MLLSVGLEVNGREEIVEDSENVAGFQDGEGAESEESEVEYPVMMAVGLGGWKAGLDKIEKW